MHTPDFDRFRELLRNAAKLLPPKEPLDDVIIQGYWNALRDQTWETVQACMQAHVRRSKFYPRPFELRPKGADAPRVVSADPKFDHAVKQSLISWAQWHARNASEARREFRKSIRARLEVLRPLMGASELDRRAELATANWEADLRKDGFTTAPTAQLSIDDDDFFRPPSDEPPGARP